MVPRPWDISTAAIFLGRSASARVIYAASEDGWIISCRVVRPLGEVACDEAS